MTRKVSSIFTFYLHVRNFHQQTQRSDAFIVNFARGLMNSRRTQPRSTHDREGEHASDDHSRGRQTPQP